MESTVLQAPEFPSGALCTLRMGPGILAGSLLASRALSETSSVSPSVVSSSSLSLHDSSFILALILRTVLSIQISMIGQTDADSSALVLEMANRRLRCHQRVHSHYHLLSIPVTIRNCMARLKHAHVANSDLLLYM